MKTWVFLIRRTDSSFARVHLLSSAFKTYKKIQRSTTDDKPPETIHQKETERVIHTIVFFNSMKKKST